MGNISNDLLKSLQNTILKDGWLEGLYGKQRAEQQQALKGVFNVVSDNNLTTSQKKQIEAKKETLQEKVERLEAKMAVLEEELAKNAQEIDKQADEITELATKAEDESEELASDHKNNVKHAIEDVFIEYAQGTIKKDEISSKIKERIRTKNKSKNMAAVEKILGQLDSKQDEVSALVTNATALMDQRALLNNQYGVTKSTYNLLSSNLAQIGNTETNYTNSDYDAAIPVYSIEKTEYVSTIFEDVNLNVQAGENSNYTEGSTIPTLDSVKEKYKAYTGTKATADVDAYSYNNEAVVNLEKALNEGMFEDLMSTGMGYSEITKFLSENFSGAKLGFNADGKFTIPYGHGKEAKTVFTTLKDKLDTYNTTLLGTKNTWSKTAGNTVSSNQQIAKLAENDNFATIIDQMSSKGFTFKEAMYALFDPNKGLFKDSGIVYDATKQGKNPSYFIEFAGDEETAQIYQKISDKIFETWGVRHSRGVDYELAEEKGVDATNTDKKVEEEGRKDPLSFMHKGTQYSFIIDRDGNKAFSNSNEFVGADNTTNWLEDMKTFDVDKDGKLSGDELKNVKLLGLEYKDNVDENINNKAYNPHETDTNKSFLRGQTTNIQYSLTNASELGITEINLEGLEDNVNKSKNIFDINGSEKFEDKFSIKLDGQDVDVTRKDETNYFMNAVYGDAYGKNFQIGLSKNEIQNVMNKDYGEMDAFNSKYANMISDIQILQNAGHIAQEARVNYQDTLNIIDKDEKIQLMRADNKAASFSNETDWSSIRTEVQDIADAQGIIIDMEQAKGIYTLEAGLSANEVVEKYKNLVSMEDEVTTFNKTSKIAWSALVACAQNGINATSKEIMELLSSGKAKTAEDVVRILKENQVEEVNVKVNNLGVLNGRETEIYEAFHTMFSEAGIHDKTVDALADLCKAQQKDDNFMIDKSAQDLAIYFLEKYGVKVNKAE